MIQTGPSTHMFLCGNAMQLLFILSYTLIENWVRWNELINGDYADWLYEIRPTILFVTHQRNSFFNRKFSSCIMVRLDQTQNAFVFTTKIRSRDFFHRVHAFQPVDIRAIPNSLQENSLLLLLLISVSHSIKRKKQREKIAYRQLGRLKFWMWAL